MKVESYRDELIFEINALKPQFTEEQIEDALATAESAGDEELATQFMNPAEFAIELLRNGE